MTKLLAKSALLLGGLANLLPCSAQANPPILNPPAGTYSHSFTLAMTADPNAIIYFTTDGTAPSADSNVYSGPITISAGTTTVQAIALIPDVATSTAASATYTVPPAASTTQLKSSASTLVLPGSLSLTATVNRIASGGAVPSGNVNFYSNTSNKLGTAPLQIIPSSQAWTDEAVLGTPVSYPSGVASVELAKGAQPVLVSAQASTPNVALYKLSPGGNSLSAYTYTNQNMTTTDAVGAGYFLQPASSSVQSFLVHWSGEYYVFDGSTSASDTGLSLNAPTVTTYSGCDCSQPDNEALSVADLDNDGYDDLGVLIEPYNGYYGFYGGIAGVAINAGSSAAGAFNNFIQVTTPADVVSPAVFCPIAITTGKFLSSGGAQLAVLASTPQATCGSTASGPFSIYLFAYDAANLALNEIGTPIALPDNNATTLAAADLNNDGISDLIIGEYIPGTPVIGLIAAAGILPSGGILTALGAGDGTFKALSALLAVPAAPIAFTIDDFSADGKIDVAYTSVNGYSILTGDGTGNFSNRNDYPTAASSAPGGITSGDFNGDKLADLAIVPGSAGFSYSNINVELNSASAQAVLPLGNLALAAGSYNLTAIFPGNSNFATSTSPAVSVTVSQTVPVITWTGSGGSLEYGTPLSAAQLNATANIPGAFTYTPGLGVILPPGTNVVNAAFAPTDSFNYAPASATLSVTVGSPSLATITPTSVNAGSSDTTITVTGLGFVNGAVVTFNGTTLVTTYVDLHHLSAVIPAKLLAAPASATIAVVDPGNLAASGSATFLVKAPAAVATVTASESTVTAGQQSTITLTLDPYPVPVTATATLTFTPDPPNTVQDPAVLFSNNDTTETVTINPGTASSSNPFQFQAGSTAGIITAAVHLALANGQDITPSSLQPVTVTVPASPPMISSVTLTRSGQSLQVSAIALSSTRDMNEAHFHFTPVSGKSLATSDVTVQLTSVFQSWYGSSTSNQYGTNFTYTQPFTLDGDATDIQSVSITLANSAGTSEAATAQ